jgi:hypothetical protein
MPMAMRPAYPFVSRWEAALYAYRMSSGRSPCSTKGDGEFITLLR